MIGRRSRKEEPARVPASEKTIEETRARVEEVYLLMVSMKLRLLKIETMIEQLHRDHEYARLMEQLRVASLQGGDSENGSS